MSDLAIRRYEPPDQDAVWKLHERALRDAGVFDSEYAHLDADLRDIEGEFLDAGGEFLVGEVGGDIERDEMVDGGLVAMGALQPARVVDHHEGGTGTGVIRRMRVAPECQRQGYGTAILEALEARAVELGFERLVLDTSEIQQAAMAFYEGRGYREQWREATPVGELIYYGRELDEE